MSKGTADRTEAAGRESGGASGTLAAARFAVYFAPRRSSLLARFGCSWLGRDARTGEAVAQPSLDGIPPDRLAALTAEPRRYGWHATLKAPFRLAPDASLGDLVAHAMAFSAARLPFEIPALELGSLGGFLALVPRATPPLLAGLAEDCVRAFDGFRAKPGRGAALPGRPRPLSRRQAALLERWGYAYVMEEFRFHMTLTARLPDEERGRIAAALAPHLARLVGRAVPVDAVSLFIEPGPGQPFRELRRFPFEGA